MGWRVPRADLAGFPYRRSLTTVISWLSKSGGQLVSGTSEAHQAAPCVRPWSCSNSIQLRKRHNVHSAETTAAIIADTAAGVGAAPPQMAESLFISGFCAFTRKEWRARVSSADKEAQAEDARMPTVSHSGMVRAIQGFADTDCLPLLWKSPHDCTAQTWQLSSLLSVAWSWGSLLRVSHGKIGVSARLPIWWAQGEDSASRASSSGFQGHGSRAYPVFFTPACHSQSLTLNPHNLTLFLGDEFLHFMTSPT